MTAPDSEAGERLGATLVEERLATCANVVPSLSSVYWWQGKVERANEALLILKTVEARVSALRERAVAAPSLRSARASGARGRGRVIEPYLDWVRREVSRADGTADESGKKDRRNVEAYQT